MSRNAFATFLFLVVFVFTEFAYARSKLDPDEVSIAHLFGEKIETQKGGTCNIYAAVNFFEAACFQATGKRIRLSRDYQYYRHLLVCEKELANNTYPNSRAGKLDQGITAYDIGDSMATLNRIKKQACVADSCFSIDANWYQKVGKANLSVRDKYKAVGDAEKETIALNHFKNSMESLRDSIRKTPGDSTGVEACFENHRYEFETYILTPKQIRESIEKGIPLLVNEKLHSKILTGYRMERGGWVYQTVDTKFSSPQWRTRFSCAEENSVDQCGLPVTYYRIEAKPLKRSR